MQLKHFFLVLTSLLLSSQLFANVLPTCPKPEQINLVGIVAPEVRGKEYRILSTPLNNYDTPQAWRLVIGLFSDTLKDAEVIAISKSHLPQIALQMGPIFVDNAWECWYKLPDNLHAGMFYSASANVDNAFRHHAQNIYHHA